MSLDSAIKVSDQVMKAQSHAFDLEAKRARLQVELIEADLRIQLQQIEVADKKDKLLAARAARRLAVQKIREIHKSRTKLNREIKNFERWRNEAERLLFPDVIDTRKVVGCWNAWFKLIGMWPTNVQLALSKIKVPKNVKDKSQFKFHRKKTKPKKFRGSSAMSLWVWCKDNGVTVVPGTKAMNLFYKSFETFGRSVNSVSDKMETELVKLEKALDAARNKFIKENLPTAVDADAGESI